MALTRVIAVVSLLTHGCSLLLVSGPPNTKLAAEDEVSCTRRPLIPVIENYVGMGLVGVAVILAVAVAVPAWRPEDPGTQLAAAGGLLVGGLGFYYSSNVGFARVTRCNRAVRRHERWVEDQEPQPASPPGSQPGSLGD